MKTFATEICNAVNEEYINDLYFTQTQQCYYADFRPKGPEKSAGDSSISHNWLKDETELRSETALVPIIKKYDNFSDLINELKGTNNIS
jgi:hypothetical protein